MYLQSYLWLAVECLAKQTIKIKCNCNSSIAKQFLKNIKADDV